MSGKPFLPDVNVLPALASPNHVHRREAEAWFREHLWIGLAPAR
jgi:hypothetical protein